MMSRSISSGKYSDCFVAMPESLQVAMLTQLAGSGKFATRQ